MNNTVLPNPTYHTGMPTSHNAESATNGRHLVPKSPHMGWREMRCSLPGGRPVENIFLDVTQACNLGCTYCFKGTKEPLHMQEELAKSAIDWLIDASGDSNAPLRVALMGGEPLLRFDLIRQIVPYGQCRARQRGKSLSFCCTTNCTLITDEILAFWSKYFMTFHCSLDGVPEVQNINRPFVSGGPTSQVVERNVRKIISFQPRVWARATVTPVSVTSLAESARYFSELGFQVMHFQPAVNCEWQQQDLNMLKEQYERLGHFYIERLKMGNPVTIMSFHHGLKELHSTCPTSRAPCSAGYSEMMIDPQGNIYPCTRFGPHLCGGQFRLGTIGNAFNNRLRQIFLNYNIYDDSRAGCDGCKARSTCRSWCYAACVECNLSLYDPGATHCKLQQTLHDALLDINDHLRARHPDLLEKVLQQPGA